jgi:hypothetical protein
MAWEAASSWFDYLASADDAWQRLLDAHAGFGKFARVLIDEGRARRVDLGDVARMVDVDLAALVAAANGDRSAGPLPAGQWPMPEIGCGCQARAAGGVELDLRPLFERGEEPLSDILDLAATVPPGGVLTVIAPFHPVPLRRLLAGRGFASLPTPLQDGAWRVVFQRGFASPDRGA